MPLPHKIRAPHIALPDPRATVNAKSYKSGADWAEKQIATSEPPPDQTEQAKAFAKAFAKQYADKDAATRSRLAAKLNLAMRFRLEPPDYRIARRIQVVATQKAKLARRGYMDWRDKIDAAFWDGAHDYATGVMGWWMEGWADGDNRLVDYSDSLFASMGL